MSRKNVCLSGLMVALLGLGQARGQGPAMAPGNGDYTPPSAYGGGKGMGLSEPPTPTQPPANMSLSNWILYPRGEGCCGPLCGGPIGSEVFLRAGATWSFSGYLGSNSLPGWDIDGGVRTLFFNPEADAAWAVTVSLSNINQNSTTGVTAPYQFNARTTFATIVPVTLAGLNRTYVNLSLGRELYLWGSAESRDCEDNLRVGADFGGRWGSERVELQEIQHIKDTIGGIFVSAHADYEHPCGGCIWQAGVRVEYGYTWSDVIGTGVRCDIQDINLLVNLGVRF
jgi:hypothetical protein